MSVWTSPTTLALGGLLLTAAALVLTMDWRLGFLALGAQYGLAALVLSQTADWQVVAAKAIVGALVMVSLILTGRAANYGRRRAPASADDEPDRPARFNPFPALDIPTNLPFRLIAVVLVTVAVWYAVVEGGYTLPGAPLGVSLAGYLLMGLGLLNLGLTEEPMNAGLGLLTAMTGFDVLYGSIEPARAVVVLIAAMHFAVALSVSYLASLRYAEREVGA